VVNGAAKCWGSNQYGRLGTGDMTDKTVATQVLGLERGVTAIVAANYHSCAVMDQALYCWGLDDSGQLGNATVGDQWAPVDVILP
jgi:alpha-tubulin suppressor-like RCC1 family protein